MARGKGSGSYLSKQTPNALYAMGTPEEIAHRGHVGHQSGATNTNPIGLAGAGGNLNSPNTRNVKGGSFKFSNGV